MDAAKQRVQIVRAAVPHVTFDGWSGKTLRYAAEDVGVPFEIAKTLCPDAQADLIHWYIRLTDQKMLDRLPDDFGEMRVRDKVTLCVRTRLEVAGEAKEATRMAVRALAKPPLAQLSARTAWKTADVIWDACGDTSTDYNFYTKRAILSGVYSATLLFWLQDESDDHQDSWAFLDRRIDNVMQFEKVKGKVTGVLEKIPTPFSFFSGRDKEAAT